MQVTASGSLGEEVLALRFNIGFSNPPAGSNVAPGYYLPAGFGELRVKGTGTALDGSTLRQVLAAADEAVGGGALPAGYSYASLDALLQELNGSFAGGESSGWANGHLESPGLTSRDEAGGRPPASFFVGRFVLT